MNRQLYFSIFGVLCLILWAVMSILLYRGISCDEGFYLLGYLQNAPHEGISDFHAIVSTLFCRINPDDPCMELRWVRFFLTFAAALLFAFSGAKFLGKQHVLSQNGQWLFGLSVMFASLVSFCFASPILYYDNIQMILYLLAFSCFFVCNVQTYWIRNISAFALGFLLPYTLTNHLPSGILCIGVLFSLCLLYKVDEIKLYLAVFLGFIVSTIIYHFYITPIDLWLNRVNVGLQIASAGSDNHDNMSLIMIELQYLVRFAAWLFIPGIIYGCLSQLQIKCHFPKGVEIVRILFLLGGIGIVYVYKWDVGTFVFGIPLGVALYEWWRANGFDWKSLLSSDIIIVLLCALIPCAAVFGTNMPIYIRTLMFVPFWVVCVFMLCRDNMKLQHYVSMFMITLSVEIFVFMACFTRYEYYGSPHKSACMQLSTPRLNDVLVSMEQKAYIENLQDTLIANGFKLGDKIMSSDENFIAVYAVGGMADGWLLYDLNQVCADAKFREYEAPKYILMYQRYYENIVETFHEKWNFPQGYKPIVMGKFSSTFPDECISTLYVRQK